MPSLQSYSGKGKASNKTYYRVQPYLGGDRITIRLGSGKKQALIAAKAIGDMIDSKNAGVEPSAASKQWLEETASKGICKNLIQHGLISELPMRFREKKVTTVSVLADEYIRTRCAGLEESTITVHNHAKRNLIGCFGDGDIALLRKKDGREFWRWLQKDEGLAENSAKQRLRYARAFFEMAIEDELVSVNPFKARGLSVTQTAAEKTYVEKEDVEKVIKDCPTNEWKLLFALTRNAPLRIPSEIHDFTWDDIDFEKNQMLIHSPKTRRLGKTARLVPIIDALRPYFGKLKESQGGSEKFVFARLRHTSNLATTAKKYVAKANVVVWRNFFNSLRASAETDLMDEYGLRRACQWAGNSVSTAMKNYALVKKTDYDETKTDGVKSAAKSDADLAGDSKNDAEPASNNSQDNASYPIKNASGPNTLETGCVLVGETGIEPARVTPLDPKSRERQFGINVNNM